MVESRRSIVMVSFGGKASVKYLTRNVYKPSTLRVGLTERHWPTPIRYGAPPPFQKNK